jgi:hypothetical protein
LLASAEDKAYGQKEQDDKWSAISVIARTPTATRDVEDFIVAIAIISGTTIGVGLLTVGLFAVVFGVVGATYTDACAACLVFGTFHTGTWVVFACPFVANAGEFA